MNTTEFTTLEAAMAASKNQTALYEHDQKRAFVSGRKTHFDFGITSPAGKAVKFDQPKQVLDDALKLHGVPQDTGWLPKQL
jgi:hypothetical protein